MSKIVVSYPQKMTRDTVTSVREAIQGFFGDEHQIIVLDAGAQITVIDGPPVLLIEDPGTPIYDTLVAGQ